MTIPAHTWAWRLHNPSRTASATAVPLRQLCLPVDRIRDNEDIWCGFLWTFW